MKRIFDRAVYLIAGLTLLLDAHALIDFALHPLAGEYNFNSPLLRVVLILCMLLTLAVAFLIIRRVPGNIVGPLLIVWTASLATSTTRPDLPPELFLLYNYLDTLGWFAIFLMFAHFPNGQIQPPRLARLVYSLVAFLFLSTLHVFLTVETLPRIDAPPNPVFTPALPLAELGYLLSILIMSFFMVLTILAPIHRYRHGSLLERQQIKWLALFAGVLMGYSLIFVIILPLLTGGEPMNPANSPAGWTFYALIGLFPPLAIGVAVLRYRLWAIDIIIRRTLIYSTLTLILTVIYFGGVVVLQNLSTIVIGHHTPIAVVITTLAIAALFTPLRRRVQAAIDRRFYRSKVDSEKLLANFAAALRDEVDFERLEAYLLGAVDESVHPAQISLWLRDAGRTSRLNAVHKAG